MLATQIRDFPLRGVDFQQYVAFYTRSARAFEGENVDGLIGYEFLRSFDVYFDYGRARVYLEPNALLKKVSRKTYKRPSRSSGEVRRPAPCNHETLKGD